MNSKLYSQGAGDAELGSASHKIKALLTLKQVQGDNFS
jgi:hypothetical protein